MKSTRNHVWSVVNPWRLFVEVLAIIFAAEAAVMLLLSWWLPDGRSFVNEAIFDACALTVLVAPLLWWLIIRPLQELAETRASLLARLLTAQEEERARIARDLHDGVGQSLTCLTVGLRAVEESSREDAIRQQMQELRRIGAEVHQEIRRLATGLRPTVLDDVGLAAALERYFDDIRKINAVQATLDLDGLEQKRVPRSVETALYRIVQEATTNALRHGHATEIQVTARRTHSQVELAIRDNGRGFDPQAALRRNAESQSFGLTSIRERVALLSGTFNIVSQPGRGTILTLRIPIHPSE